MNPVCGGALLRSGPAEREGQGWSVELCKERVQNISTYQSDGKPAPHNFTDRESETLYLHVGDIEKVRDLRAIGIRKCSVACWSKPQSLNCSFWYLRLVCAGIEDSDHCLGGPTPGERHIDQWRPGAGSQEAVCWHV